MARKNTTPIVFIKTGLNFSTDKLQVEYVGPTNVQKTVLTEVPRLKTKTAEPIRKEIVTINGEKFEIAELPDDYEPSNVNQQKIPEREKPQNPTILNKSKRSHADNTYTIKYSKILPKEVPPEEKPIKYMPIPEFPGTGNSSICKDCNMDVNRRFWFSHYTPERKQCEPCNLMFLSKCQYNKHLMEHQEKFNCLNCGHCSQNITLWKVHKRKQRICNKCRITFCSNTNFTVHKTFCDGKISGHIKKKKEEYKIKFLNKQQNEEFECEVRSVRLRKSNLPPIRLVLHSGN